MFTMLSVLIYEEGFIGLGNRLFHYWPMGF